MLTKTNIFPTLLLFWVLSSIIVVLFGNSQEILSYSIFILLTTLALVQRAKVVLTVIYLSAPMVLPLVFIHSCLNAQYEVSQKYIYELLPFREAGFQYSLEITSKVLLITIVGVSLSFGNRNDFLNLIGRFKKLKWALLLYSQAMSAIDNLTRAVKSSFESQKSRGFDVEGSFLTRIKILPKVISPVIISTLVDAHRRSDCLVNRGLSSDWEIIIPYKISILEALILSSSIGFILIMVIHRVL